MQDMQLTHILDERMKELAEKVERMKALKDVAKDKAKEKGKAADVARRRLKLWKRLRW